MTRFSLASGWKDIQGGIYNTTYSTCPSEGGTNCHLTLRQLPSSLDLVFDSSSPLSLSFPTWPCGKCHSMTTHHLLRLTQVSWCQPFCKSLRKNCNKKLNVKSSSVHLSFSLNFHRNSSTVINSWRFPAVTRGP